MTAIDNAEPLAQGITGARDSRHLGHLYHHLARGGGLTAFSVCEQIFRNYYAKA